MIIDLKKILIRKNLTISVCESASGGALSFLLTSIDGSSEYFKGGIISYSNEIKNKVLGIDQIIIEKYGSISAIVANKMCELTKQKMNSDICISITGNASINNLIENQISCMYFVGIRINKLSKVYKIKLKPESRIKNQINIAYEAIKLLINLLNNEKY